MKPQSISYGLITLVLRAALILALFSAGWLVYKKVPIDLRPHTQGATAETTLQLVMRPSTELTGITLEIPVELYPVDIVAVRHEYFTERRAGKRFDDFLAERMNGRKPVTVRLDQNGQAAISLSPGTWWVHAVLSGNEDLEWRLPINVSGSKQTIELTTQNAYERTKSF
ncbi:MAG: hypothetical protein ABJB97_01265 [Acidobacteriota bacterium]